MPPDRQHDCVLARQVLHHVAADGMPAGDSLAALRGMLADANRGRPLNEAVVPHDSDGAAADSLGDVEALWAEAAAQLKATRTQSGVETFLNEQSAPRILAELRTSAAALLPPVPGSRCAGADACLGVAADGRGDVYRLD